MNASFLHCQLGFAVKLYLRGLHIGFSIIEVKGQSLHRWAQCTPTLPVASMTHIAHITDTTLQACMCCISHIYLVSHMMCYQVHI